MSAITIAIDPGVSGAIAIYDGHELLDVRDMPLARYIGWKHNLPDAVALAELVFDCFTAAAVAAGPTPTVVVEAIAPRPGNGMSSVAASAASWGVLIGATHGCRLRIVTAQAWTKALGVGSDKAVHRSAAEGLYPGRGLFGRAKDDGRADAVLIGHYWLTMTSAARKLLGAIDESRDESTK